MNAEQELDKWLCVVEEQLRPFCAAREAKMLDHTDTLVVMGAAHVGVAERLLADLVPVVDARCGAACGDGVL